MIEKSLVFIKPDGVKRQLIGQIIARFEQKGLTIESLEMMTLTDQQIDAHYEEHVSKPFYPNLKAYIKSGPVVVMICSGENAISAIRQMVGATDCAAAEAGSIRGQFGLTKSENLIHASDSPESAAREIKNFQKETENINVSRS